ncbi:hypothetical protein Q8G50_33115, partial [Klebsiella pneumoniae]
LLTTLVGLLLAPAAAAVMPTWLPLPGALFPQPAPAGSAGGPAASSPAEETSVVAVLETRPASKAPPGPPDPMKQADDPDTPPKA